LNPWSAPIVQEKILSNANGVTVASDGRLFVDTSRDGGNDEIYLDIDASEKVINLNITNHPGADTQPFFGYFSAAPLAPPVTPTRYVPDTTSIRQNYPNPFNPETWIPYELAKDAGVSITIYNSQGHMVRTTNLGFQQAGSYITKDRAYRWDGNNNTGERAASGIYFYTIIAGDYIATKKMVILK